MSALALLLFKKGAYIQGCDTSQRFPTQEVLESYAIVYSHSLKSSSLPEHIDLLIYSSAYESADLLVMRQAKERGVPCLSYAQALGDLSQANKSIAVVGTHGKTTTTAMAGSLLRALGAKGTTLVGSAVKDFENLPIDVQGEEFFLAEVCEYRRHFLNFKAKTLLILNIDWDHVDYFASLEETQEAFLEMGRSIAENGHIIYCADDLATSQVIKRLKLLRKDITYMPYGLQRESEDGAWIRNWQVKEGKQIFEVRGWQINFELPLLGKELVLNAVGALTLVKSLGYPFQEEKLKEALKNFKGVRRRQEKLGLYKGALIMDDYAHHPKEIEGVCGCMSKKPLQIAISGLSGCGNTTLSRVLAKELGLECINYTFRNMAQEKGLSFEELRSLAEKDDAWDRLLDKKQLEIANNKPCVLASRLAIWFLEGASCKIYLHSPASVRFSRIAQRESLTLLEAQDRTQRRDAQDALRYKRIYGIDILDPYPANLILDSAKHQPTVLVEQILVYLSRHNLI
ncbi:UNVERIFIED_CONTAM: hypothetical protein PYX00_010984 [Menopon gallinae]|uniref:(d)CMP kinase n=1 Tax=Menopon gallinae TaxID=328185 RepID=A0AAW2H6X4_9NEOP